MEKENKIKFSGPARYRIVMSGKLDTSWSDSLGGLDISIEEDSDNGYTTTLEGEIQDQASLSGILNTLYEMHLTLLKVECLSTNN